jgi:hypothetical protein
MLVQVNQLGSLGNGGKSRLFHSGGLANKGEHGAVMVLVRMSVQNSHTGHSLQRGNNLVHNLGSAGFREIRDAFNNFHWHVFPPGAFLL